MCTPDAVKPRDKATIGNGATTTTTTTTAVNNNGTQPSDKVEPIPVYTLREHCEYLALKTECITTTTKNNSSRLSKSNSDNTSITTLWYCDWTPIFCPNSHKLLKDIVQDYCQPISNHILDDGWVGISNIVGKQKPVRTISFQLRPDAKESMIWKSVKDAFHAVHPKHACVLQSPGVTSSSSSSSSTNTPSGSNTTTTTSSSFQAIGADGNVPLWLVVDIATNRESWQRRLWIRIFHASQSNALMEEELQKIGGISNQKTLLGNGHTPWNIRLAEACSLVQYVVTKQLAPDSPCPKNNAKETSEYFRTNYKHSNSVKGITTTTATKQKLDSNTNSLLFPSLSNDDYAALQESVPLVERIWSELELQICTFNTLTRETKRFGMCGQPTLDKSYCQQLAQVSQQYMLMHQIRHEIELAEQVLHDSLQDLHQVQGFIIETMRNKYNVDISDVFDTNKLPGGGDYGQTPIALPKRDASQFPWHPAVRSALEGITNRVVSACLKEFDPLVSIAMANNSVHNVMQALSQADDVDQQLFLKQRNRQAMIRLTQQQAPLQRLIREILPQQCQVACAPSSQSIKGARKLRIAVQHCQQLIGGGEPLYQVPLVEFALPRGGCVILTPQYLIIQIKPIMSLVVSASRLQMQVHVIALSDVHVLLTPDNLLSKVTVRHHCKDAAAVVAKFSPASPVDLTKWVQLIEALKGLQ